MSKEFNKNIFPTSKLHIKKKENNNENKNRPMV